MRIVGILSSSLGKGEEPERRKGVETGNIARDGYRVTARATDDYQKDRRRCCGMSHSRNLFESCDDMDEDD